MIGADVRKLPVWRSLLYVPANVERFIAGAHKRGADAIIIDLEDSVPAAERSRARRDLAATAASVAQGGADVVVRINRPWRQAVLDLEAAVSPRVQALALTKVDSADDVRLIAEVVGELEAERGMPVGATQFIVMIETAAAFFRMPEIAGADRRIVAMTLGAEDFARSVGVLPEAEALLMPKQQLAIAARAAGIMPLGFIGTVADYQDLDAFRRTVQRSRRLGFLGASVIHPSQVPILNAEFAPSAEEVDAARRIVAAYEQATAAGRGSIAVDGKMVDVPVVERAQQTLRRHAVIAERERQDPAGALMARPPSVSRPS
jgi:citrate lyase subunit beta / citryl-CoA lyase